MPVTYKPRFVSVFYLALWTFCVLAAFGDDSQSRRRAQALLEEAKFYVEMAPLTAARKYEEALAIARETGDRPIEAMARLGRGSIRSPDVAEQIAHLKIAAELFAELGDRKGQAEALEIQGRTYVEWTFNRLALESFDHALELRRAAGGSQELAALYARRADVHELLGNYEQALRELENALSFWQEAGSQLEVAKLHYRLALLNSTLGLDDPALLHLEAAEDISETLSAGFDVGQFRAEREEFGTEWFLPVAKAARTISERMQERSDGGGRPQPSDPKLTETREKTQEEIERTDKLPFPEELPEDMDAFLGALETIMKEAYEGVSERAEEVKPLEAPLCAFVLATAVKNALGELYAGLGHDELANERFEAAWAVWAANDQSYARSMQGVLDGLEAEGTVIEAAGADTENGFDLEIPRLRQPGVPAPSRIPPGCKDLPNEPRPLWKADAFLTVGRPQEALAEYQKYASGDVYRGEIPEVRAAALRGMGDVHMEMGDARSALASYLEAVEVVEGIQGDLRLERLASGLASRQAGLYSQAVKLAVELRRPEDAFSLAERGRARAFLNRLGNRRIVSHGAPPELAAKEQELRERRIELSNVLRQVDREAREKVRAELEDLRKEHARVLERIQQENPEYAQLVTVQTVGLDELPKLLEPGVALVVYFALDDRTVAWVVDRERTELVELKPSAAELERRVEDLRGQIRDKNAFRELGGRLYVDIFAPLEQAIRHQRVVVVPHGALHYLPFSALWNPVQGSYLIESYAFTSVPSASSLRYLSARRSGFEGRLLALGNPEGNLDAAETEVRAVAALFGTKPYVGSEASESLLRRRAAEADVLHLAAHAVYVPHAPFSSYVALAGERGAALESDGKLEVAEVYDLDLSEADLVVLSACDTALGQLSRGDDVVGLARAFLQAGPRLLVSTLWEVDDRSSAALMESFYGYILKDALTPATALRQAQLDVLRTAEWSAPFHWAAFLASGVDRPR